MALDIQDKSNPTLWEAFKALPTERKIIEVAKLLASIGAIMGAVFVLQTVYTGLLNKVTHLDPTSKMLFATAMTFGTIYGGGYIIENLLKHLRERRQELN